MSNSFVTVMLLFLLSFHYLLNKYLLTIIFLQKL
jgi:hypothetical protein